MYALHLLASPHGRGGTACRDGEGDGTKSPLSDALRRQLSPGRAFQSIVRSTRLYSMFAEHPIASPHGRGGTTCRDGEGDGTTPQRVILSGGEKRKALRGGAELLGATRLCGADKSARRVRRRGILKRVLLASLCLVTFLCADKNANERRKDSSNRL